MNRPTEPSEQTANWADGGKAGGASTGAQCGESTDATLPPGALTVVDRLCDEFEAAWRAGQRPRIEDFLDRVSGSMADSLFHELLELELQCRRKACDAPQEAEYAGRFSAHVNIVRKMFQTGIHGSTAAIDVPGYEILSELGRGGMGVVYKARQITANRIVALKMILAGAHASTAALARFRGEAEAIAQVQHPNIVQIYEVGEQNGLPFFSLEYCSGGGLDQKLHDPLSPQQAVALVKTLAQAVHAAHTMGVIHRDLKPANVLLAGDGTPKISDFGLAKKLQGSDALTESGAVMGTPAYMAPEQASGQSSRVTTLADVYSLGAILYECLAGRPPFRGDSALDTMLQVLEKEPEPPSAIRSDIDRDLDLICLKCLAKEPAQRYASAEALAADLDHWLVGAPLSVRPPTLAMLLKLWLRQNFGAAGWTLAIGVVCGLLLGMAIWLGSIQRGLGPDARVWEEFFPNRPLPLPATTLTTPTWLGLLLNVVAILAAAAMGFAAIHLVKPKNRSAEVATGLMTGLITAVVAFVVGTGWWGVGMTTGVPMQADLAQVSDAAFAVGDARVEKVDKLLERYPELADVRPEIRGAIFHRKLRVDLWAGIPRGLALGLLPTLVLCVSVATFQSAGAGHLIRTRPRRWMAAGAYAEFALTSLMLLNSIFTVLVVSRFIPSVMPGGTSLWNLGLTLIQVAPMVLGLIALFRGWSWPWRVPLHLLWLGTGILINWERLAN